jgi:GxxExxY protein
LNRKAAKVAKERKGRQAMKDYLNNLSKEVIGAAIEVHRELGPGLLESSYEASLEHELKLRGIASKRQVLLPVCYKNLVVPDAYRIDLLVDDVLVLELKTVNTLLPIHSAQVLTYLKMSNKHLGLLINFHSDRLADEIKRLVHNFPQ